MKEYIKKNLNASRIINNGYKTSQQAPLDKILQIYTKERTNFHHSAHNFSPKVTQLQKVLVSYDPDMQFGGPNDELSTTGLFNCIAIVAYDSQKQGAVMTHYDTVKAYEGMKKDDVSQKNYIVFGSANMEILKAQLDKMLLSKLKHSNIQYCVGLGAVWHNINPSIAHWMSRHSLIQAIITVFNMEPTVVGRTINYNINSNTMIGDK